MRIGSSYTTDTEKDDATMKIGIMCAPAGLDPLLARLQKTNGPRTVMRSFVTEYARTYRYRCHRPGVARSTAPSMPRSSSPALVPKKIILTGLAGGLDETVRIGDASRGETFTTTWT